MTQLPEICPRCSLPSGCWTGTYFGPGVVCCDCSDEERTAPGFEQAYDLEHAAVLVGDQYFPGVPATAADLAHMQNLREARLISKSVGGVSAAFRHVSVIP